MMNVEVIKEYKGKKFSISKEVKEEKDVAQMKIWLECAIDRYVKGVEVYGYKIVELK